jgi:hypothetical protein
MTYVRLYEFERKIGWVDMCVGCRKRGAVECVCVCVCVCERERERERLHN